MAADSQDSSTTNSVVGNLVVSGIEGLFGPSSTISANLSQGYANATSFLGSAVGDVYSGFKGPAALSLSAEQIKTDSQRIVDYVLSPLTQMTSEAMHER